MLLLLNNSFSNLELSIISSSSDKSSLKISYLLFPLKFSWDLFNMKFLVAVYEFCGFKIIIFLYFAFLGFLILLVSSSIFFSSARRLSSSAFSFNYFSFFVLSIISADNLFIFNFFLTWLGIPLIYFLLSSNQDPDLYLRNKGFLFVSV